MTDAGYTLTWEPAAIDRLAALVKQYPQAAEAVIPAIYDLTGNPRPAGSSPLGGTGAYRRLLLGYFRVLYSVDDAQRTVHVFSVGRADQAR